MDWTPVIRTGHNRNFSHAEWDQFFGPQNLPYTPICPGLPIPGWGDGERENREARENREDSTRAHRECTLGRGCVSGGARRAYDM